MNVEQYLLNRMGEECAEVSQECSKAINFGMLDWNPTDESKTTNKQRIINELNDLMGVISLCVDLDILPKDWLDEDKINKKRKKVVKYMHYSQNLDRLDKNFDPDELTV